jgi:nicotinamidase-related amidase
MRTALVVVDMLEDFVDGVLANPAAKLIISPIASLAELARKSHDWSSCTRTTLTCPMTWN